MASAATCATINAWVADTRKVAVSGPLHLLLPSAKERLAVHKWAEVCVPPLFHLSYFDAASDPPYEVGMVRAVMCDTCMKWCAVGTEALWYNACCGDNPDHECDGGAFWCVACIKPFDNDDLGDATRVKRVKSGNNMMCLSRTFDHVEALLAARPHMAPKRTPYREWYDTMRCRKDAHHVAKAAAMESAKAEFSDAMFRHKFGL